MTPRFWLIGIVIFILLALGAMAHHDGTEHDGDYTTLDETLKTSGMWAVIVASIWVGVVTIIGLFCPPNKAHRHKKLLFLGMVIPIALVTGYLASTTVYLNTYSSTGGPVHWHADFELWQCGKRLDLLNPTGLMNRIGTPVYHEHNDDRIHIEGVVWKDEDIYLSRFFTVIGGALSQDTWSVPTNDGMIEARTGETCPDGSRGELQAFVWEAKDGKAVQRKIDEFTTHTIEQSPLVPPGECLIMEFGPHTDTTEHICTTYRLAIERGDLQWGDV